MFKGSCRPWMGTLVVATIVAFVVGMHFHSLACTDDNLTAESSLFTANTAVSLSEDNTVQPEETIEEVVSLLRNDYVTDISEERAVELSHAAIRGMLAGLYDPYAMFMDPGEFENFRQEYEGYIEGIGAALEMTEYTPQFPYSISRLNATNHRNEYDPFRKQYKLTIAGVISGGPADRAGLRLADEILEIDGIPAYDMSISEAVENIRGAVGTTVSLLVHRIGENAPLSVKVLRDAIDIPAVEKRLLEGDIGYLQILSFNDNSVEMVAEAIAELKLAGMKGLILDVRNNPGGKLDVCLRIAEMFVPGGPLVYIQEKDSEPKALMASKRARSLGLPLVVLVNHGSLSASELLAGAIQDSNVGKIVGERTFGKGLVQRTRQLADGSAVRITTAQYLTPKKHEVNERGIIPDKEVKLSKEEVVFLSQDDLQAMAAIKMLKQQIAPESD